MSFLNALKNICPKVAQFIKFKMPLWDKPVNPKMKIDDNIWFPKYLSQSGK